MIKMMVFVLGVQGRQYGTLYKHKSGTKSLCEIKDQDKWFYGAL